MGSLAHDKSEILFVIKFVWWVDLLVFFSFFPVFLSFQNKKYVTALRQCMKQSCF